MKRPHHITADSKAAFLERLRSDFYITTMFVPVKTLANLIGLSPSTLYSYIRQGEFFLPVRHIHKMPLVSVEDFADWYLDPANVEYGAAIVSDGGDDESQESSIAAGAALTESLMRERLVAKVVRRSCR